jgi:transcriptional regulator
LYIPEYHRVEDHSVMLDFMRANPFAILISNVDGSPYATHAPLLVHEAGEQIVVRGHIAKANPHWKSLSGQESLVIFHGPHAYISPTLYENRENVPTWNYGTIHVYGEVEWFSDHARLSETLHGLIHVFESSYMAQWASLRDEYRTRMLNHIVGFELKSRRIEAKFKLSQQRTKTEQARLIESLSKSEDSIVSGTAELMRQEGLGH